jgi:hypothetical protein
VNTAAFLHSPLTLRGKSAYQAAKTAERISAGPRSSLGGKAGTGDRSRDLSRISLKSLLSTFPPTSDLPPAARLKRLAVLPKKQPKIPPPVRGAGDGTCWSPAPSSSPFFIIQICPDTESIRCSRSGTRGPQEKSGGMLIIRSLKRSSTSASSGGRTLGAGQAPPGARVGLPQELKVLRIAYICIQTRDGEPGGSMQSATAPQREGKTRKGESRFLKITRLRHM